MDSFDLEDFIRQGRAQLHQPVEEIEFDQRFNLVFVKVKIGEGIYDFLFDTGFPFTVISRELSQELQLDVLQTVRATDVQNNSERIELAFLDRFSIGEAQFFENGIGIIDLRRILELKCLDFDGIIGGNSIGKLNWQFDFSQRRAKISGEWSTLEMPEATVNLPFHLKDGTPRIFIDVDGYLLNDVLLDTGASDGFAFGNEAFSWLTGNNRIIRSYGFAGSGAFGDKRDSVLYSKFENLVMGDRYEQSQFIGFSVKDNRDEQLILGMEFLKAFRLGISYENRLVQLQSTHLHPGPQRLTSYGFRFWYIDRQLRVSTLFEGSAAQKAGLQIGDLILSIQGQSTIDLTEQEFCALNASGLLNGAGELRLLIQDGEGQERAIVLSKTALID